MEDSMEVVISQRYRYFPCDKTLAGSLIKRLGWFSYVLTLTDQKQKWYSTEKLKCSLSFFLLLNSLNAKVAIL